MKADEDGEYFIDRSPQFFPIILDYLRGEDVEERVSELNQMQRKMLHKELEFYCIQFDQSSKRTVTTEQPNSGFAGSLRPIFTQYIFYNKEWKTYVSKKPLSQYRSRFRITIHHKSSEHVWSFIIGVTTRLQDNLCPVYMTHVKEKAWGITYTGDKISGDEPHVYTNALPARCTITVEVNFFNGKLVFYIDGNPKGVAFTIPIDEPLYPAISVACHMDISIA